MADGAWKVSEIEAVEADCPDGTLQPVSTRIAAKSSAKIFRGNGGFFRARRDASDGPNLLMGLSIQET